MARKKPQTTAENNGSPSDADTVDILASARGEPHGNVVLDVVMATASTSRDTVKVNNMNLTDLKNACDDAVKRVRRISVDPMDVNKLLTLSFGCPLFTNVPH